ncbi:hypothetical protein [Congregibacter sp.]|uniref:hypothetical protein n=1 Tax=Congregibacter sp. TaxID=2744308 RepID=UPI00385E193A
MTKLSIRTVLILLATFTGPTLAEHPPEFDPVVKIFSGLSYSDKELVKAVTTTDFLLLEMGEVWDLDFLLPLLKPNGSERNNYFSVISVSRFDGVALINYWNKATIIQDGAESKLAWLESVVAVETETGWQLKQMHSTRIDPKQIPEDVEFELMMVERSK